MKIRGYRIELGEIEANLVALAGIRQAVVVARADKADARLVAYMVADGDIPTASKLREMLRTTLPDYMLPQYFVQLPALPLLPNGKLHRQALPDPTATSADPSEYVAPRNATEQRMAAIWQELLQVDRVGVTDNFFDLGGHSLLAMRAVARIEAELGILIDARSVIFETLGQLAGHGTSARPSTPSTSTAPRRGLLGRLISSVRAAAQS
ncbi:MAG: phosphopantetheine-binding protein [Caldimonas sp.]